MVGTNKDIHIQELCVYFPSTCGPIKAVDMITTTFRHGEITTLIGESGCGKSVLAQALLGMLPHYVHKSGRIIHQELDILTAKPSQLQTLYRQSFGLIPQNPGDSLNPLRKIGKQMADILQLSGASDHARKTSLLNFFGLNDSARVLHAYPHELSGGMQQRVLCAMGISNNPHWLVADEPTKGLDAEVCRVVYENILKIKHTDNASMLIITHDLDLARAVSDQSAIMYGGQILEQGPDIFTNPQHPYTRAFLAALPENGFQTIPESPLGQQLVTKGCKFAPRCAFCAPRCLQGSPDIYASGNAQVRCFLYA